MSNYIPLIGLEIHVQLNTETKLFCPCPRKTPLDLYGTDAAANINVCPTCLALPGAMPYLNKSALEKAVRIGIGLHCSQSEKSVWDRKNYFYPDLFNGYQISQLNYPVNYGGYVDISNKRITVDRAHLENDAAKSLHSGDKTLLDANKSGVPLVEIVSAPNMRNADEAKEYAEKVREIVRWVNASDADMYLGEMKFDINISLCVEGDPEKDFKNIKHTPIVEVKNRNSFKELNDVINYEIKRQTDEYEKSGITYTKGSKVTMGWDEVKGTTFVQREKEESDDYRYFPEPDIPPVSITEDWLENIKKAMPEPMDNVIDQLVKEFSADKRTVSYLVGDRDKYRFFNECKLREPKYAKNYINWIAGDIPGILAPLEKDFDKTSLQPQTLVDIIKLINEGKITQAVGKDLLKECLEKDVNLEIGKEVEQRGLATMSDIGAIEEIVKKAIADNPKIVEDIKKGKETAKMAIVGAVMRESKGKADINVVKELIDKLLSA